MIASIRTTINTIAAMESTIAAAAAEPAVADYAGELEAAIATLQEVSEFLLG